MDLDLSVFPNDIRILLSGDPSSLPGLFDGVQDLALATLLVIFICLPLDPAVHVCFFFPFPFGDSGLLERLLDKAMLMIVHVDMSICGVRLFVVAALDYCSGLCPPVLQN